MKRLSNQLAGVSLARIDQAAARLEFLRVSGKHWVLTLTFSLLSVWVAANPPQNVARPGSAALRQERNSPPTPAALDDSGKSGIVKARAGPPSLRGRRQLVRRLDLSSTRPWLPPFPRPFPT